MLRVLIYTTGVEILDGFLVNGRRRSSIYLGLIHVTVLPKNEPHFYRNSLQDANALKQSSILDPYNVQHLLRSFALCLLL